MTARIIPAALRGHNITEAQAHFMAKALRAVAAACREAPDVDDQSAESLARLSDHAACRAFHEAALVAGFVCADFLDIQDLEPATRNPRTIVPRMSMGQLKHFVHSLHTTHKTSNVHGASVLWKAAQAGTLDLMAERLETDGDLRKP